MSHYCVREDVIRFYGEDNITQWADMDNDRVPSKINDRINWAIEQAEIKINDGLRGGPYAIPFVEVVPRSVTYKCAQLTGIVLYEARGLADTDSDEGNHKLSQHKKEVDKWIRGVLGGQVRLEILGATRTMESVNLD